jgi:hypothetical protein
MRREVLMDKLLQKTGCVVGRKGIGISGDDKVVRSHVCKHVGYTVYPSSVQKVFICFYAGDG